jgi:hypothetical protein
MSVGSRLDLQYIILEGVEDLGAVPQKISRQDAKT